MYDNCRLYAPDGQLLCTCDRKKAEWYINKQLAGRNNYIHNIYSYTRLYTIIIQWWPPLYSIEIKEFEPIFRNTGSCNIRRSV